MLDQYRIWLRDKTTLRPIDEWIEITTPYLDRHNDCLQIYARRADGGFVLTDDGYIIEDLEQSGCRIDGGRRRALLDTTLNGFGVQVNKTALEVRASSDNFALRKHNLIQAMLAVNDLFYLASSGGRQPVFHEDVVAWLDLAEIRYTPNAKFTGKSGYDHRLRSALARLNPGLPDDALEDALRRLTRPAGATLEARNRHFHRMLVAGVTVSTSTPRAGSRAQVRVLDFRRPGQQRLARRQLVHGGREQARTAA